MQLIIRTRYFSMSSPNITAVDSKPVSPISQVLSPIRGHLIFSTLLAAIGTMLTLVPLAGIAHIAELALRPSGLTSAAILQPRTEIGWTVIVSVICMFAGMALVFAGELTAHLADNRITHHLRLAMVQRLAQVPLGWFSNRTSGEVKQAMQDDIVTLHSLTAHFYTAVGRAGGAILISGIYLFWLDWRMAALAALPFPGFFLFLRHAMKTGGANMQDFATSLGQLNGATVEFVSGMPVVKAFGVAGKAHRNYRDAVNRLAEVFIKLTGPLVIAMAHAHAMIAPITVLGVVLSSGAVFVGLGWMAPVEILPFALVAPGICAPLLLLHTLLHDLGSATGAAGRILGILETPVLEQAVPTSRQVPEGHEVRFQNVSYSYDQQNQVLSNVSFTLKPNTVTAIVGPSGAGKSTLAQLLLRFFDPSEGHITLGDADLRCIETTLLYQQIGFVLQDVRLIHASVRDNIALGHPSASSQEVEDAARAVNIHDHILALPRGYDSVIGDDATFSGGERQRLSIARALLLDPPILILDEATAAADSQNEDALQRSLSHFAQGRTILVIAHKLDTVMHADRILVVDQGNIVEQGTHAELLKLKGRYAQLWASGGYDLPAAAKVLSC